MVWLGPAGIAVAGPAGIPYGLLPTHNSDEPFRLYTTPVYYGGLLRKWLGVAHELEDERVQLALCDGDRDRCVSKAALKFLRIVDRGRQRDGRARLGEINRAINPSASEPNNKGPVVAIAAQPGSMTALK
jgi:hypothetical protein